MKTDNLEQNLKPCPFCGNKAYLIPLDPDGPDDTHMVECLAKGCGTCGNECPTPQEAADFWNTRQSPEPEDELLVDEQIAAILLACVETEIFNDDISSVPSQEEFDQTHQYFSDRIGVWRNEKHCGDCTDIPGTCVRCMYERTMNQVQLLKKYIPKVI